MTLRLSPTQKSHLVSLLIVGERPAYPRLRLSTLESLRDRGLVKAKYGRGAFSMPRNNIRWSLTAAGRKLIEGNR